MLRVTPVYGSRWQASAPKGSCTLVEYAGVKVLVNVGGPVTSSLELPDHDCLVLSDSTLESLGSLPRYCEVYPEKPVYATFPTVKMGQMTLWDHHAHISLDGGRPPFTLEQVDAAIARMQTVKYSQSISLGGLSITAHRAGHVVGGAFWLLSRMQDETNVVVTSTYSIAKEQHLDSSTLLKYGATPDVLVTRPGGPAMPLLTPVLPTATASQTHKRLMETIMSVLRREGNVLLPVDAAGRVLELILLLNQHWEKQRLSGTYNLVWLGPMVGNTLDFARSQLEWMNDKLGTQFDTSVHPFGLKEVRLCTHVGEVDFSNPTCIVANGMSLDHGPARDLLLKFADNDNHAILFTDSSQCWERDADWMDAINEPSSSITPLVTEPTTAPTDTEAEETQDDENRGLLISKANASKYTTSFQLLQHWCQAKLQGREMDDSVQVDVLVPRRAPLMGPELQKFLEQEEQARLAKRQQQQQEAMLRQVELAKGRLRLGEQDDKKPITLGGAGGAGTTLSTSNTSSTTISTTNNPNLKFMRPQKKSRFDSSLFLKFSKPLHFTFGVTEDAVGIGQKDATLGIGDATMEVMEDDYGIAVEPEHFVDIVTGVDPSKFAGGSGRIGEDVLRRGFGFGSSGDNDAKKKNDATGEEGDEETEGLDERGLEAMDLSEGKGIIRGRNGRQPTKVTTETRRILVFCEIDYIPLEGRVDSRSARQSVRALQPRQVVVLGGTKPEPSNTDVNDKDGGKEEEFEMTTDEVRMLVDAAESLTSPNKKVYCLSDSETAELNVGHAAFSVRLIATPYRTPEERALEVEPPDPIELHETELGACTVSYLDYVATGQKVALDGSIVLAPRKKRPSNQMSLYLSDGEVLLTDLRTDLIAQGMKAEYSTHSGYARLVVNGKVIVKKNKESGRIHVEGPLCEDFFTVRTIVCGQYVIL